MRSILALGVVLATNSTVQAADPTFPSSAGNLTVHTVAQGLSHPWSLAFLPDGRMLVTERPGRMRIVGRDGTALTAAQRRAESCGAQTGRVARCHARS